MQDFVKFKMAAVAILCVAQDPCFCFFGSVCFRGAMFQVPSKMDNKWPSYAWFFKFKMAAAAILDVVQTPAFTKFQYSMLFGCYVSNFIKIGQEMAELCKILWKFNMAAAAILNVAQTPAFTIFQ